MAATESGDGHQRLATNQVPSAQVSGAATEGADEESMEAVSEAEATVDAGDSDLVRGSPPRLSEHAEEDNFDAAEKETESKESEVGPLHTDETFSTVLVHGGEAGSPSESGHEGTGVKTEEEMDEENVVVKDKSLQESEGKDMDTTSDCKRRQKSTDSDSKEGVGTQQERSLMAIN
ncbi:zinc finger MYM-type protein 4 isoform X1 [Lates japonicus]|uniref:Zinc finger MYM-type protein 4 isoform X1 n=1 Tax=Lates japonicus TaxID=270547 RepID=A0AAD3R8V1_LATJO|nr:zinc finger MYM-type protein 4 isoform X1 [Lates japonicus]